MEKEKVKIGIVGAGNVGKAFATLLTAKGYDVELVMRSSGINIGKSCMLEVSGSFGNYSQLVRVVDDYTHFTSDKNLIIVAIKTYDMVKILKNLTNYLVPGGAVITLQNVFSVDKILRLIPGRMSVCMHMDISCQMCDQVINMLNAKGLTIGIYNEGAFDALCLTKDIFQEICEVDIVNDFFGFSLGRNIINGTISLLGAISGLYLGQILNDRNGRYLFCKLIEEAVQVIDSKNIKIFPYNDHLDYYQFIEKSWKGAVYRHKIITRLRKYNKNVKSSILKDLENGRQTELKFLLDTIIRFADRSQIDIRYTKAIYEMIHEIETGARCVDSEAFYDKKLTTIKEN